MEKKKIKTDNKKNKFKFSLNNKLLKKLKQKKKAVLNCMPKICKINLFKLKRFLG